MSSIQLYNTATATIEPFKPLHDKQVSLYVCGVTPYDTSHLGHAFVFTVFDTLKRFLEHQGYTVTYTQNVTDIDDPLIEKAREMNTTWEALTEKWTAYLLHDFKFLNIRMPDHYIKATQELPTMIEIITALLKKGHAYQSGDAIYYDIASFPSYGSLSRYDRETMLTISSERGNDIHDTNKKNPLDFVLWKRSAAHEPSWESPWGAGRPGWHIECTAMSMKYLGRQIDIHGGGDDLIFPHHESEIAQAEGYTGISPFVKTWMHCAMVAYQGEKMSKSLGNLVYVQDLAKKYSANAIRYFLMSHHYRQEWEYKDVDMERAAQEMKQIESQLDASEEVVNNPSYITSLAHDLNIPEALGYLLKPNAPGKTALFDLLGFVR